jgi:hypothetical protein
MEVIEELFFQAAWDLLWGKLIFFPGFFYMNIGLNVSP